MQHSQNKKKTQQKADINIVWNKNFPTGSYNDDDSIIGFLRQRPHYIWLYLYPPHFSLSKTGVCFPLENPLAESQSFPGLPGWLSGKESICQCRSCRRCGFDPWVGKIPWRRKWQPTLVFLPGKSLWTEEPGRLQPIVSQRVRHDWAYTRSFPDQLSFSADAQMKGLSSKRSAHIFQKRLFGIFSPKLLL